MVATNVGASGAILLWSVSGTRPNFIQLGTGSQTMSAGVTNLVTGSIGTSPTVSVANLRKIDYTADYSSVHMSGIQLTEFGLKVSGGNVWTYQYFPAITFDGTNELRVELQVEMFPSGT
jgi:hypothetical protein